MKKILFATDETLGTRNAFTACADMCSCMRPDSVVLVYVEKFEGRSLIDEMLSNAELATLENVLRGTEYQEALDKKAHTVLGHYRRGLEDKGQANVKTVIRKGHPAEEILKTASDEHADMIVVGTRKSSTTHLFMGSVSKEVADHANVPVLVVKQA